MNKIRLLICAAALVAGCSEPPNAPPAVVSNCSSPKTVKIQLFGDSTMLGWANGAVVKEPPQLLLQAVMDSTFGPGQVTVEGRAVGGTKASDLLAGTDKLNKPWPQSVQADIAVVNFGINDSGAEVSPEVFKGHMRRLAVAPAVVVFQTPLPVYSYRKAVSQLFFPQLSLSAEVKDVAREKGITVADASALALSLGVKWPFLYTVDRVHPTADGYRLVVHRVLAPTLIPIVDRLRCDHLATHPVLPVPPSLT